MSLKYLFKATFADGSIFDQKADDVSEIDPKKSSFSDFLEKEKTQDVTRFELHGEGHIYAVDLKDGHFEIDGVPFSMHNEKVEKLRVVFTREHTHTILQTREKDEELSHTIVYRMGWESQLGMITERVMRIS